ncbi:NAD(P)H-quinone oxidoreductase [Planosporangium thailandense]|uniref:NAD(P)H-quinone oxidoreductase n=1 Tax=Planosporangium thailandense TaxID=765197 RepID=A0ABX0XSW0_9ACTN|nr:NAD(P)H-quinone oxidoreductase [Planosporangium thailandense]
MYAVTIREPGGPDVLEWTEVPDPEPQPGEVVINVTATAVNRADVLQRQGFYPPPPGAPPYPGLECSGVIERITEGVEGWQPGDEVCALLGGGGYAQKVAVPASQVLPKPRSVSLTEAAALPEVSCTVWSNVTDLAKLRAGETFLVHGGGSGIGTFAVQYAKALGAKVVTTARAAKHDKLADLGADVTIDYTTQDFADLLKNQVNVVLDIMGGPYLPKNVRTLATGGRLMIIATQGGRTGDLDVGLLLAKRGLVAATTLRTRPLAEKAAIVRGVRDGVWPLVEDGRIRPIVYRTVPMPQAGEAHRILESSEHFGKIVLVNPDAAV